MIDDFIGDSIYKLIVELYIVVNFYINICLFLLPQIYLFVC